MVNAQRDFAPVALAPLPVPPTVTARLRNLLRSTLPLQRSELRSEALLQQLLQGAASFPPPPAAGYFCAL